MNDATVERWWLGQRVPSGLLPPASLRTWVFLLGLIASAYGSPAQAQSGRVQQATRLFEEARALLLAHEWAAACAKLEASLRLDPQLGTQLHLAHCYEQQGRTASAWLHFRSAAQLAAERNAAGHLEQREGLARARAAALQKKLSVVNVQVDEDQAALPGFEVQFDGHSLRSGELNHDRPVDPGSHLLAAAASGYESWNRMVYVGGDRDKVVAVVPTLARRTEPAPSSNADTVQVDGPSTRHPEAMSTPMVGAPAEATGDAAQTARRADPSDAADRDIEQAEQPATFPLLEIGYTTGALGVVAGGIGIALSIMTSQTVSERDELCPTNLCEDGDELQRFETLDARAKSRATAANAFLISSGVLVSAAVTMLLLAPGHDRESLNVALVGSPHSASMMVSTRF